MKTRTSYVKFCGIRQIDIQRQFALQPTRTADDSRIEILRQVRSQYIRIDGIVHATTVHSLIEETMNVIPLNISTG